MRNDFALCKLTKCMLISLFIVLLAISVNKPAKAQSSEEQQWWFNVELIIFKRDLLPSNNEDFSQANVTLSNESGVDLWSLFALKSVFPLQRYISSISLCNLIGAPLYKDFMAPPKINYYLQSPDGDEGNIIETTFASLALSDYQLQCISQQENEQYQMAQASLKSALDTFPTEAFAPSSDFQGHAQLIDKSSIALADYASKVFKQRDLRPLLHTAWRQEVLFGVDNAEYMRITAGSVLFDNEPVRNNVDLLEQTAPSKPLIQTGSNAEIIGSHVNGAETSVIDNARLEVNNEKTNPSEIFDKLRSALSNKKPVDWLALSEQTDSTQTTQSSDTGRWELDGLLKVYLEYVNQVPYLHIESEFTHHKLAMDESGLPTIKEYPFKQRRRIISKQIHYFDHPAFGFVVRLERFTPPVREVDLSELLEN